MAKKKVTTRTCGKCKIAFPVGKGHDARTCGKKEQSSRIITDLPLGVITQLVHVRETLAESGGFSSIEPLVFHASEGKKEVFCVEVVGEKISTQKSKDSFFKELNVAWLRKYTHVTDGKTTAWFNKDGLLHRADGPAVERANENKEWWVNGERHRVDGPAVEWASGLQEWFENGERHRIGLPAVEFANGRKVWFENGKRHRLDGPAVEDADGHREWYVEGKLHRLDGPAVERADGHKEWMVNGKRHRLDGPAFISEKGETYWFVEGKRVLDEDSKDCEKAANPETTREEFFHLTQHKSRAVRVIALNNPACPAEWRVLARLLPPTQS